MSPVPSASDQGWPGVPRAGEGGPRFLPQQKQKHREAEGLAPGPAASLGCRGTSPRCVGLCPRGQPAHQPLGFLAFVFGDFRKRRVSGIGGCTWPRHCGGQSQRSPCCWPRGLLLRQPGPRAHAHASSRPVPQLDSCHLRGTLRGHRAPRLDWTWRQGHTSVTGRK